MSMRTFVYKFYIEHIVLKLLLIINRFFVSFVKILALLKIFVPKKVYFVIPALKKYFVFV